MSVRSCTKIRKNSYTKMVTKFLGFSEADTAILVSPLLPSEFWLRGFQILYVHFSFGSSAHIVFLDLYDGPYNGGTGEGGVVGKLLWRSGAGKTFMVPSTILFENAYIPISNGLYVEWPDGVVELYGERSGITVFWT